MISEELLKQLRIELNMAIAEVAKKHKLNLKVTNASYSPSTFTFKLEGALLDKDGMVVDRKRIDYETYCHLYNIKRCWLDKEFTTPDGETYKIVGLNSKARKNPIIAEDVRTKKRYRFTSRQVIQLIDNKEDK